MSICSNCGGNLEKEYSYCPYCGYMNETAAKRQYLEKIKDISRDLEELPRETKEIYEATAKKEVHRTFRIFSLLLIIFVSLALASGFFGFLIRGSGDHIEKELEWEREYFPVLDSLYEEKDYDGILSFMDQHYNDPGECFYLWENYEFMDLYGRYKECLGEKEKIQLQEERNKDAVSVLIYDACHVVFFQEIYFGQKWEEEQEKLLLSWKKEMEVFLISDLRLTAEEIEALESCISEHGYLTFSLCEEIAQQAIKR